MLMPITQLVMGPKGLLCPVLGLVTVTAVFWLAIFVTTNAEWCDGGLNAGDCQKYIDDSCFCIEKGSEDKQLGLFENAQAICEDRNGTLATPEERELLIWLSKRMFFMGVDVAFIGLRRIYSKWYWTKAAGDEVPAQNIIWRPDFPEVPGENYGIITVETIVNKNTYESYNYDHYAEKNKTYQWFGITTRDNAPNRLEDVYHICRYASNPELASPTPKIVENTTGDDVKKIMSDPCDCPRNIDVVFEELDQTATFISPKYPAGYCSGMNCRWTVRTPEDLAVKLEWNAFNLEKDMDFVHIYDGENDQFESEHLDTCTGSRCNHQESHGNTMHVHFSSDHANATTDLGFKFKVTAVEPDPCYCSASSLVELSNLGESYTLLSPNYPHAYCGNRILNCSWTVVAPKGFGLRLLWKTIEENKGYKTILNTKLTADVVTVYDGSSIEADELTKCNAPCENVISTGESLHINFLTDGKDLHTDEPFSAVITVVRNYCEKSKLESPDMLGTVSYNQTREDNKVPPGGIATLTCANSAKIDKTLDQTQDTVTCKSPDWERDLKICKEACTVNISLSYAVPFNNMSICKFVKNRMTALVADGDAVKVTQKDFINDKILSPPMEHTCQGTEWTNGKPDCHINGIIFIGGDDEGDALEAIDLYSPAQNLLTPLRVSLKTWRYEHGSALLRNGGKVIVVGGTNPSENSLRTTEIIDLINGEVVDGPKLIEGRDRLAVTIFNQRVVVCGGSYLGFGDLVYHSSCEMLNDDWDKWSLFPKMSTPRANFGLVVLDDCLYAVGGRMSYDGELSSTERFCAKKWEMMADLKKARYGHGMAVLDHMMVVCGGHNWDELVDCEKYMSGQDMWLSMAQLNEPREFFIMAVYGGKLFALGGRDNGESAFGEEYDLKNDVWNITNFNPIYKAECSVVVIG